MAVYHRVESTSQTIKHASLQESSGQIWGKAGRGSNIPKVKAYLGPLPVTLRGVEFETDILPDLGGSPKQPTWSLSPPPVFYVADDTVAIRVKILKNTQKEV